MSMDRSPLLAFATAATFLVLLPSPAVSQCATQAKTLPSGRTYANCTDLPYLNATLHFTYDQANSSLAIAYIAAPAPNGAWVSWAINPTDTGMAGGQAIVALKPTGGSAVVVKTFNMSSYSSVVESPLSFDVWGLAADEEDGKIRLFASVKVPESATSLNQVWQVGGVVNGTRPRIHPLGDDNKQSKGKLELVSSPAKPPSPAGGDAPAPDKGAGTRIGWSTGVLGVLALAFGLAF